MSTLTTNQVTVTLPGTNPPLTIDPESLPVQAATVGDPVIVTFSPGPDTQITGIAGLPTNVSVQGPDQNGNWTASYIASSVASVWTYYVSAQSTGSGQIAASAQAVRNKINTNRVADFIDPEIDNTPPPQN